ncbi:hypothetical protein PtB15_8B648 [Puccinia triticina]|nr:hypothetical protein PtB15_8B648 [Puccinia triticina]
MPPPPERTYQSQKALYDDAQAWAKAHGYAIICARSNVPKKRGRPQKNPVDTEDEEEEESEDDEDNEDNDDTEEEEKDEDGKDKDDNGEEDQED